MAPRPRLVSYGYFLRRRVGVVAFTGVDPIGFLPHGNLDLAELAIPILVLGVVA